MHCPRCQTDSPTAARFCPNCGAALTLRCSSCQTELLVGARFCMHCGQPVRVSTPVDDARLTRLAAAAPAPLVDKVRAAGHLAGERRVVTVLFADVVGSTTLAEQMDVEAWTAIMNGAFDQITPAIYRYEGTIARLLGDALWAFFGAPVAHEDDPLRAVHAALDLLAIAREYAAQVHREHGIEFAMRVCLHTGPVVVGPVGDDLRYDFTAVGDVVNVAARLKFAAQPMSVLISENTHRFVAPIFDCTDLGPIEVKGRTNPVRVYQVRGPKAEPDRVRGLAGLESPMVGRAAELVALLHLSEAVRAGLGRAVAVVGEPGLGKTRLIAEWKATVGAQRDTPPSLRWVEGRCLSYGQGLAYHLLIDLLRSLVGVSEAASEPETRAALLALTVDLFGDSASPLSADGPSRTGSLPVVEELDVYPYLGHLLSLKLEGAALERVQFLDPQAIQAQYLGATRRLFRALAARHPLALILEDLQWADPSSVELLTQLLPLASAVPLLFCLVTRRERDAPGWKLVTTARDVMGAGFTELTLDALSETDSRQLVSNLLKIETLPKQLQSLILEKAEGNPLFVEEVIRMLIDRGAIVQANGRWVAGAEIESVEIPDNLQGLLLARVDRLPDDARHTLRVASVIGRQFAVKVLEQVLGRGYTE